jgi:Tol biopolymer transport system component/mono/diheme cytochrome c family protein
MRKQVAIVIAAAALLPAADKVTFSENIAPIVYDNCVTCHRPGEAAPFSLISYEDVKKRGTLIATVTKARYMPPWHATHGYGEFADERRLTDQQIATIAGWVQQGMPQGDPAKMPALPQFAEGWHLGKPDLILEMPVGFELPASGPDVFRNFVIPTGLKEDKWVRAIEFRPSARKAAHHALFAYAPAGSMSRIDGVDGKPGFGGMGTVGVIPGQGASGGLGGWAVGGTPAFAPGGLAAPLPKGSDFLLQMHFHLTGKPETEKATIGIYFADKAPERNMTTIGLPELFGFGAAIDIPPGEKNFTIQDSLTLPVDVKVYGALAHAHYLAKEIKATATLPDGSVKPLIWIQDWDFNWQEQYTYKQTFVLPKGTRIDAMLRYDNSTDNPRNPSNPPKRALFGEESFDEMAMVGLTLVTVNPSDEPVLQKATVERAQAAIQKGAADGTARRYLLHQAAQRPAAMAPRSLITLVDRQGKAVQTVGELGSYSQPALSPDGTRVAVIRNDQGKTHVWVLDVSTGKATQITSDAAPHTSPVWSPDGKQIAYVSNQNDVYRIASDGSGKEELIYKHPAGGAFITDWSVDGRLCFWSGDVIYALPVVGDRKPVLLVRGARGGRFSPDAHYLAYSSNQSGRFETYMASLDNPSQKPLQVSKDASLGGVFWRQDSKELFFFNLVGLVPSALLAADITVGPEPQAGVPRTLFPLAGVGSPAQVSNIATRDGQRFVILAAPPTPAR